MIDKFKKLGEWKIHLTMEVNFISSKDNDDKRIMHSRNDNIDETINDLFESLLSSYKIDERQ